MNFSIIVPTKNSEQYLKPCLESIVNQKHDGKTQIIVIDGESEDETRSIIANYDAEFICGKDRNEPDALNKGLKRVNGDIVAFLDSDDLYESNAFQIVEETIGKNDWLYGKSHFINENGKEVRRIITGLKQMLQKHYSYELLCNLCFICQPSVFIKREFRNKIGEYNADYPLIFDYEYWLRAGKVSEPLFVDKYLSSMRVHDGSNSVKFSTRQMTESLDLVYRFKKGNHYVSYAVRAGILISTIAYYRTIGKII
jgi:glycosyltransferase involved in cell wall biosynthesis